MLKGANFKLEMQKSCRKICLFRKKHVPLHPLSRQSEHWRDGRVVDYSSLENYRTERYRGFESLSLRKEFNELIVGLFFLCSGSGQSSDGE